MAIWKFFTQSDYRQLHRPAAPDRNGQCPWKRLGELACSLTYEHGGGKLPRHHLWRTYRLTEQGAVLAVVAIQHSKWYDCLNIEIFLTAQSETYDAQTIARAATLFLLSDAFKSGGTMQLLFQRNVEQGRVPQAIVDLASGYGVELTQADQGIVTPREAIQLYLACSELSRPAAKCLQQLREAGLVSTARACYLLHHGVWTKAELEQILGAPYPELTLGVPIDPLCRHLTHYVFQQSRNVAMGGILDRALRAREISDDTGENFSIREGVQNHVDIAFEAGICAKRYRSMEGDSFPLPAWSVGEAWPSLSNGDQLLALLRARDADAIQRHFEGDLKEALKARNQHAEQHVAVIWPFDFRGLPESLQKQIQRQAREAGLFIGICPESIAGLDAEIRRRLNQTQTVRG